MKIAIFSDTFEKGYGGVTVYARENAFFMLKNHHDVKVFTWNTKNLTNEEKKICRLFPCINIVKSARGKAGFAPIKILEEVKRFRPNVIHNHSLFTMGIHAIFCAKMLNIPLIHHFHTYLEEHYHYIPLLKNFPQFTKYLIRKETTHFFNTANLVIAPTKIIKNYLVSIGIKKHIEILPFGIDTSLFVPSDKKEKKFTLLYVGRLLKEKKVDLIIKSFALFSKHKNDVQLKIVGRGTEEKNLKILAKKMNVLEKITFIPWLEREKLPHIYNSSHVFIILSNIETFGIVVLEAMASGLPVIAADNLALSEHVKNGYNGYLTDVDDISKIADKMEVIYKNARLREFLSLNSRKYALNFDIKKIFKKLEYIYKSIDKYKL